MFRTRKALFLLLLFVAGCAVNPVTEKEELMLISEAQEVALGEENYPITTQINGGLFQDDQLQGYVNTVGQRIASFSHRPHLRYEFNVVNSSEVNAYALPGGKISITRGLLTLLESEDQLAAVLGHEVGHVAARHSAAQISRTLLAQTIIAGVGAAMAGRDARSRDLYYLGSSFAATLLLLKYSRDQERQADLLGLEYMTRAGYNPVAMLQVMEILQRTAKRKPSRLEALFQSHPLTEERIERIRAELDKGTYPTTLPFKVRDFAEKTAHLKSLKEAYMHFDRGDRLMEKGDYRGAEGEYRRAIDLADDQSVFYGGLAWALMRQGRLVEADISIRKALRLYPDLFSNRYLAGLIAFRKGDYFRAIRHLRVADRLIPDVPQVKFYLGRSYEITGNYREAVRNYREVIRLAPESPEAAEARRRLRAMGVSP